MSLTCSAGVLWGRANVVSSRSFFRPAMFDLGLEWTVEVGGGERARRHLPEEDVEKKNTLWLVARHYISRRWAGNQSNWVKLKIGSTVFRQKQTHVEPMSETVRKFFIFSSKRMSSTKSPCHKYELIFSTIYIFQTKILEYRCWLFVWQLFFHLIVNDSLKQQTAALKGLHAIICLIQTGILWWNDVAVFVVVVVVIAFFVFFFSSKKKGFHQNIYV